MHPQTRACGSFIDFEFSVNGVRKTNKNDVDIGVFAQEVERRLDRHMGTVVAPHGINRDSDFSHERSAQGKPVRHAWLISS
jgi:hypothetical protein